MSASCSRGTSGRFAGVSVMVHRRQFDGVPSQPVPGVGAKLDPTVTHKMMAVADVMH